MQSTSKTFLVKDFLNKTKNYSERTLRNFNLVNNIDMYIEP